MAKKLNKRAKIIIATSVAAILLIGAIISIVLVLAATQQNISSNISIAYVVDGVGAKVSANYGVVPNSTDVTLTAMTTSDGHTTELVFNTSDSQSQKALTPNGNINPTINGVSAMFSNLYSNTTCVPVCCVRLMLPFGVNAFWLCESLVLKTSSVVCPSLVVIAVSVTSVLFGTTP